MDIHNTNSTLTRYTFTAETYFNDRRYQRQVHSSPHPPIHSSVGLIIK